MGFWRPLLALAQRPQLLEGLGPHGSWPDGVSNYHCGVPSELQLCLSLPTRERRASESSSSILTPASTNDSNHKRHLLSPSSSSNLHENRMKLSEASANPAAPPLRILQKNICRIQPLSLPLLPHPRPSCGSHVHDLKSQLQVLLPPLSTHQPLHSVNSGSL